VRLKKIFSPLSVGLLHGRLKLAQKNEVVDQFSNGKIDILVTTPVVEVGIDMPNATIMIIEGAERFGLAQLHQLRGRIGRSDKKAFCLIFANGNSSMKVSTRLNALKKSQNGRELSELDLKLRGPGEVFGLKQSGFFELKAGSWSDFELIKQTRQAVSSIKKDKKAFKSLLNNLKKAGVSPT
jgi:ATP-dependent DNA helicase RecG